MKKKSALKVNSGIQQPSSINKDAIDRIRNSRKKLPEAAKLAGDIISGDRNALSKAITLVESSRADHQETASEVIRHCLPYSGKSFRLGITGVPGAGKSTFIESFGNYLISANKQIAVLAIDPSSERSGGSILGDKTRMESLSGNSNAFIRPSPAGGTLGGVARKTRESIFLCEAAGFDVTIIETVGVGQSETTVHSMVDFFLILMIPGAGDELQGMKRGIMELADAILINKADGDNIERANLAKAEFTNALHLFPIPPSGWPPKVETCSAIEGKGMQNIWEMISDYRSFTNTNRYFQRRRKEQNSYWMYQTLTEGIKLRFFKQPEIMARLNELEEEIQSDEKSSFEAASEILNKYFPNSGER